jgi:hypothetical protein
MAQPVDIEPLFDRFVLFFSDRGLHRTMPATKGNTLTDHSQARRWYVVG